MREEMRFFLGTENDREVTLDDFGSISFLSQENVDPVLDTRDDAKTPPNIPKLFGKTSFPTPECFWNMPKTCPKKSSYLIISCIITWYHMLSSEIIWHHTIWYHMTPSHVTSFIIGIRGQRTKDWTRGQGLGTRGEGLGTRAKDFERVSKGLSNEEII